jgi:hypothetical protein
MSYTYTTFVTALANSLVVDETDSDFIALLPTIIDDAEQRIYRELDLVSASVVVVGNMTAYDHYFTLPTTSGHVVVVDQIAIIDADERFNLLPSTKDVIDYVYPSNNPTSPYVIPKLWYRLDDTRCYIGPVPNWAYSTEVTGTIRPTPLSNSNGSTFLTSYLSDLFFAAAMCSAAGTLLKNYGAASEDAQQAMTWEGRYQTALVSARNEELRKLYISANSPLPASAKA